MICPACSAHVSDDAEACFTCGHLLLVRQGALIGQRYEVLSWLGKGGMGTVYKAHDRVLDEIVALKVLRGDVSSDLAKRFRSEIKLARRVTHPNVCRINEYGEEGHRRYISMELVEGVDLRERLKRHGPIAIEEVYELAIQIAKGLQAIHKVGIVHRDLKTANIMQDQGGRVLLMDFGIAKQLESAASGGATTTGAIVGTPEYMSPEQGRAEKVDTRSDIYALGVVVFELATGQVPFRGDTPLATILKHVQEPPPLDAEVAARVPERLRCVLAKALAKDPADRYRTARDMVDALREARALAVPAAALTPIPSALAGSAVLKLETPADSLATPVPTLVPTIVPPAPREPAPQFRTPAPARPAALSAPIRYAHPPQPQSLPRPPLPPPSYEPRSPTSKPRGSGWRLVLISAALTAVTGIVAIVMMSRQESEPPTTMTPQGPRTDKGSPFPASVAAVAPTTLRTPPTPSEPAPAVRETRILPHENPPAARPSRTPSIAPSSSVPSRGPSPTAPVVGPPPSTINHATPAPTIDPATTSPAISLSRTEPPPLTTPGAAAASPPRAEAASPGPSTGLLQLGVRPWAEVIVDGESKGTTPMRTLTLSPGIHTVRLLNPDYQPLQRKLTIRPGETTKLEIDFALDGIAK